MRCGKPLDKAEEEYCADCRDRASSVVQGRSLWLHRDPVPRAVYWFKYHNRRSYGTVFAREMERVYGGWIRACGIEVILPVPLHPSRKRKRGFNQAEILARELSGLTGIPARADVLYRIKKTRPQKMLGPGERSRERAESLRGAFAVKGKWSPCKNVLLIDDIYTTGATVERAAKMLKKAGVQNVYFLTISIGQGI